MTYYFVYLIVIKRKVVWLSSSIVLINQLLYTLPGRIELIQVILEHGHLLILINESASLHELLELLESALEQS